MGFESTLTNVVKYLEDGRTSNQIYGFANLFPFPPDITDEGAFTVGGEDPGHKLGSVVYLHMDRPARNRVAIGGINSGVKRTRYEMTFMIFTRSAGRKAQMVGHEAYLFIDSLTKYIEANRTANSNLSDEPVFMWGEGETLYADDLEAITTLPRTVSQGVKQTFSTMRVTILEFEYA